MSGVHNSSQVSSYPSFNLQDPKYLAGLQRCADLCAQVSSSKNENDVDFFKDVKEIDRFSRSTLKELYECGTPQELMDLGFFMVQGQVNRIIKQAQNIIDRNIATLEDLAGRAEATDDLETLQEIVRQITALKISEKLQYSRAKKDLKTVPDRLLEKYNAKITTLQSQQPAPAVPPAQLTASKTQALHPKPRRTLPKHPVSVHHPVPVQHSIPGHHPVPVHQKGTNLLEPHHWQQVQQHLDAITDLPGKIRFFRQETDKALNSASFTVLQGLAIDPQYRDRAQSTDFTFGISGDLCVPGALTIINHCMQLAKTCAEQQLPGSPDFKIYMKTKIFGILVSICRSGNFEASCGHKSHVLYPLFEKMWVFQEYNQPSIYDTMSKLERGMTNRQLPQPTHNSLN